MTPETSSALAAPGRVLQTRPAEAPASAPAAVAPSVATRPIGRFPTWLRAVDNVHGATKSPLTLAVDLAVLTVCGVLLGVGWAVSAGLAAGFVAALYLAGRYAHRSSIETQGVFWYASLTIGTAAVATLVGVSVAQAAKLDVGKTLIFGAAAAGGLVALRCLTWMILAVARRRGVGLRRTLIVGHSAQARTLALKLDQYPAAGLLPVAMLPLRNGHGYARLVPEFPSAAQLALAIEESSVEHVVLAPDGSDEEILECVKGAEGLRVEFSILPPLSELFLHPGMVAQVGGMPLITLGPIAGTDVSLPGKRPFDLALASLLLILFSPLLALTAVAIKVFDRGPVIYRQRRVGLNGKVFRMLKFRSMVPGAERLMIDLRDRSVTDGLLFKVNGDPRITMVGRIIRRLSIDELPQLWNVIRGEMSLVGPRPLAVNPEDFNAIDNKRHTVPPGITGYWQVAGDNALSYEEMVKLDLAYVAKWSLWLDLRLLLRTIPALMHRRGPS